MQETQQKHARWMPVAIVLLVFLVYGVSLGNQFVWDDEEAIVQNQLIHSLSNFPKFWTGGIFNSYGSGLTGGFYRPLTTTVMATLWAISHDPWIFRLFHVSLHATASVLLFFLLHRILYAGDRSEGLNKVRGGIPFRSPVTALATKTLWRDEGLDLDGARTKVCRPQRLTRYDWQGPQTLWLPFAGSALFAVHPGISEAVLWISTLADPLAATLLLTSFLLFFKHTKTATLFFFLALLTKESTAVFLPVFLLLPDNRGKQSPRSAALWLGMATVLYALLRISAVGLGISSLAFPSPIAQADGARRLLTVPAEITYYLRLFLWPFPLSISRHFVIASPADVRFWGSLLILVAVSLLIVKYRSRSIIFFTLWFFLGLLPYFQLIPLSATVADRWLYLPSVGLIGLILIFLERLPKRVVTVICGTVVLVFSLLTIQRSLQWKNGLTLFTHDVSVNPRSFDLQNNYGVELFRAGDIAAARQAFDRSITLNPRWWVAYNNAGAVSERLGDTTKAEMLYRTSMDRGSYYLAYENLAKLLLFQQENPQEAKDVASRALAAFPASDTLWLVSAIASYQLGNQTEALSAAQQLYRLSPSAQYSDLIRRITNYLPL